MKIETKEIYKCDFCNKLYQLKRWAEYHEKCCHKNPENKRACLDCQHLGKKNKTVYSGLSDGDSEGEIAIDVFYCIKKDDFMHPPKSEHKKNVWELGDVENKPMPMNCEQQKSLSELML